MTERAVRDIADRLARVERELHALATAPRAPHTSVRNGSFRITDDDGNPVVALASEDGDGTFTIVDANGNDVIAMGRVGGETFLRVMNDDATGPVFEVTGGNGIFPPALATWVPNRGLPVDANGRPTWNGASFTSMFSTVIALTSDTVSFGIVGGILSAGTCDWKLEASTFNTRDGHSPGINVSLAVNNGYSGSGSPFSSAITIPTSVWSPASNPIGTLLIVSLEARIASGAGTITADATYARCV